MRLRNYCFTLFDVSPQDLSSKIEQCQDIKYCIFQEELCPSTNRRHLQGYVEFAKPLRLSAVKTIIHRSVHLEPRRGSREEARNYCRKDDTRVSGPFEFGSFGQERGHRSDLDAVKQLLDSGATNEEIADQYFGQWCRYSKAFEKYRSLRLPTRDWKTTVTILWGVPGSGKTRYVYDKFPRESIFELARPNGSSVWWDGYEPIKHSIILLDDFYGWIPYAEMLRLMDRYPHRVPIKGGFTTFNPKEIYITSNVEWKSWYKFDENPHMVPEAFKRRIDHIIHFNLPLNDLL